MAKLTVFTIFAFLGVTIANPLLQFNESKLETRIVGGVEAVQKQFPYLVSIQDPKHNRFCMGSILNEDWILTVASCMLGIRTDDMVVIVGTTDISEIESGIKHKIEKFVPHKKFNATNTVDNDIALIKTVDKIKFSPNVLPIKLAESDLITTLLPVVVPGWGTLSSVDEKKLQFVSGIILEHDLCVEVMKADLPKFPTPANDNQICTLTNTENLSGQSDTGAPVISITDPGVLIGLVSKVYSEGEKSLLFITHVWKYVNWIDDTIKENTLISKYSTTNSTIKTKSSIELIIAFILFIVYYYK